MTVPAPNSSRRRSVIAAGAVLAALLAAAWTAPAASAGTWIQASCVNPDGSAAPSEGWLASTSQPAVGGAPIASAQCSPASPMTARLSDFTPAPTGTSATLTFAPPPGSTLVGGTVDADLWGGGYSSGSYNALASAQLDEPTLATNAFLDCNAINFSTSCPANEAYSGQARLPSDANGDLYAYASCDGKAGYSCNTRSGGNAAWADVEIHWARLTLASAESPRGSQFSGSALARRVSGTAHLVFTASVPAGPGVYDVQVQLDGLLAWSSVPNSTDPSCNPVANVPASPMMFDHAQPCPVTETADASVPTSALPDGRHELAVVVTDAAGNQATVYDQNIVTSNPQTTPSPHGRRALHTRFVVNWTWAGRGTQLVHLAVTNLARHARVTVRCTGRGCPRLRVHSVGSAQIGRLLRALDGRRFAAGDVLHLTVSARGRRTEHVRLQIRDGLIPRASLAR